MPFAPELRTHSQKVCTLYKKAMRLIEGYYIARHVIRYHQVTLRNEFDCNRCVCDPKEQRRLLWLGEHEIFNKSNPIPPMKFPRSYGLAAGVAAERNVVVPDWVLDYWHPLEKAQYPKYFKLRLESQTFLAALRRFISRRGKPREMTDPLPTITTNSTRLLEEIGQRLHQKSSAAHQVVELQRTCPSCQGRIGRIIKTHDGEDSERRIASIQTAKTIIKRGFNNICPLPISYT